jgi:hypothetical protein
LAVEAFIAARRGGGRVTGGATRRQGVGEGHGANVAVGRRGVADIGLAAALAGSAHASGVRPAVKQGRAGADRWAPATVRAVAV